jgi:pyruvate ferredoxin oxidoreductase alpha subunit
LKEALRKALKGKKAIAVMDRADSFNAVSGPLFAELTSALYGVTDAPITNYIYGLGGRDISVKMLHKVVKDTYDMAKKGKADKTLTYLGVRE